MGHSFGSILSYTFADLYPELSDALVLTGFTLDTAYVGLFAAGGNFVLANQNQNARFGDKGQDLPDGYLIPSDNEALKYLYMKPGFYSDAILDLVGKTKQPVTLGEILTLLSLPSVNSFTGPVMAIIGGELKLIYQNRIVADDDYRFRSCVLRKQLSCYCWLRSKITFHSCSGEK